MSRAGRPRLSLAPESFAPSAAPAWPRLFPDCPGVRGPRCLRDSGGGCSFGAVLADGLSRAAVPKACASGDAGAVAGECVQVNARRRENLTRSVILQLILSKLKADEMLESRIGDSRAYARLRQRIDGRVNFPRLAWAGQDLPDGLRECCRAAIDANSSASACGGVLASSREVQGDSSDLLGGDHIATAQRNVEIGQHDLTRRTGIPAQAGDRECHRRNHVIAGILAIRAELGHRRSDVDRCRIGAVLRVEHSDVAGSGRNPDDRAVAAHGVDAATILVGDIAAMAATGEQRQGENCGGAKLHLGNVLNWASLAGSVIGRPFYGCKRWLTWPAP